MRPRGAWVSKWFLPARAHVMPRPLGVVGIIVPWNYPLFLAIGPMVAALVAGNLAMVKMSEYTPAFSQLFAELVRKFFAPDEIEVITGGPDVAAQFSALPFDHLLFTGSTGVGRLVMAAAAQNLTPVTLELGGKSPAIVAPGYSIERAAQRVLAGKLLNAGQTCIAPDYVLVPHAQHDRLRCRAEGKRSAHVPARTAGSGLLQCRQSASLRPAGRVPRAGGCRGSRGRFRSSMEPSAPTSCIASRRRCSSIRLARWT